MKAIYIMIDNPFDNPYNMICISELETLENKHREKETVSLLHSYHYHCSQMELINLQWTIIIFLSARKMLICWPGSATWLALRKVLFHGKAHSLSVSFVTA